jgi:predicted DNA-binding transcriptional regulator YafY
MSQRQQLERIMEIDRRIRAGEYPNADKMAEILEVSRRVIYNDRSFMIYRLGAPIEYDKKHGGWFYTDKTWVLPGMMVTEGELLAFFLSMEISKRYVGTDLESPLRSAVDKIARVVKGPVSVDTNALRSHYTFSGPTSLTINEVVLTDLHHAIINRQQVWMRYFTAGRGEVTERVVFPYHIHNFQGDWFLIAFDTLRNDFRIFLMGRIEKWQVLPDQFERDADFSAADWIGSAFQLHGGEEVIEAAIWFSKERAPFIRERLWHPSQQIEEREDGSLILKMQTAGLMEVRNWVLQFGSQAEVLAPEMLRDECKAEIADMMDRYKEEENHDGEKD